MKSWIRDLRQGPPTARANKAIGRVWVFGAADKTKASEIIRREAPPWQRKSLLGVEREVLYFAGRHGPVWILQRHSRPSGTHYGLLDDSDYTWARDQVGGLLSHFRLFNLEQVCLHFCGSSERQELGALVGLELAAYSFRDQRLGKKISLPELFVEKSVGALSPEILNEAVAIGRSVNVARHLVNLPANELNPVTYPQILKAMGLPSGLKMEVWGPARLRKEKMYLHLAVGEGSAHPPSLVHLSWRPKTKSGLKPVAFVGKGITFDTGGVDIKPSSAMRLMKKDMGGSAAVAGLAFWAASVRYPGPLDFYLALAENSVDGRSFRPGDIYQARNGMSVEIDNTDAEGRLVLADAMDVAQTAQLKPSVLIDVATLTGAIKAGLGAEVAGLFANNDELADELLAAGQEMGDPSWRMPLVSRYWSSMSSNFADFKNSSDGWGGAVTAALFLQKFVRDIPWAHFDIYAWADKPTGAVSAAGANGQAVQGLIGWLRQRQ
ncbi:MAG: leucyl aminopeptidase family protein [Bdellovibrionaceae bacterium]|nr:leucyl aminopeptidase family protein [Pseudobdellovibrionaceae bacterium]